MRTFGLFAAYDVVMSVVMVATWLLVGIVDLRVAIVTSALRSALWIGNLYRLLTPVRRFEARPTDCNDALVLEADDSLQHLALRAALSYSVSWIALELLWIVLAALGVPAGLVSGTAELTAGLLFAASAPALTALIRLLLESAIGDARAAVGEEVAKRGLNPPRPPVSLTRPVVSTSVSMLIGAMVVSGGGMIVWSAQIQRQHAVELQQHRVEHSLTRMSTGAEPLDGVELVEREALSPELDAALTAAGLPASGELVAFHDIELGLAIAAAPVDDGRVLLATAKPKERLELIIGVLAILTVTGTPTFALAFWLFARLAFKPLERFTDASQQFVKHGELDGLERIVPLRNDELGRLAHSFNAMLDILQQLTAAAAAVSAGDLEVELDHPGELHDAFRGMLVRLSEIVGRMRETSLELASAAAEITALTQEQEQAAVAQSASIQQVATTVSSLAGSAEQIADAAQGVRDDAEQAVSTTDAAAEQIALLREHTASIGALLQVIGEISDRSDLLALNGSLEATRAGEAGRGFALVANEMRRLAERVTGTVEDVRVQVTDVESSSANTVLATEESRTLAQRTASAAREISQVTAAQSSDTEEAARGVQQVADMVAKATLAMSQTRAAAEGLSQHAAELERLISTFVLRR